MTTASVSEIKLQGAICFYIKNPKLSKFPAHAPKTKGAGLYIPLFNISINNNMFTKTLAYTKFPVSLDTTDEVFVTMDKRLIDAKTGYKESPDRVRIKDEKEVIAMYVNAIRTGQIFPIIETENLLAQGINPEPEMFKDFKMTTAEWIRVTQGQNWTD